MTDGNGNGMNYTTQECRIGDCIELMRELPAASVDTVITSPPYHGLRDCGDFYCQTCAKFITLETIDEINATQRPRKTERISEEILPREAEGEPHPEISLKNMRDVWKGILWSKDATDMLKKMWSSTPTTEWESPQFSKGEYDKLEGRTDSNERLYSNIRSRSSEYNQKEICDGTPISDGKTSRSITTEDGRCPPQKRNQRRQSDRELGSGVTCETSRESGLSILPENIQDTLRCPFCLSDKVSFKHVPWIAGTTLDPFAGSGTVLKVCRLLNRNAIGLELNPEYKPLIHERSMNHTPPLGAYV
jgi:hypothetical protein